MDTTLEDGELEQSVCSFAEKSWYEASEEIDRKMTVSNVISFLSIFFSIVKFSPHILGEFSL